MSFAARSTLPVSTTRRGRLLFSSNVLEDKFGRFHNYLRISLTEKCNLRCTYCMPEEGVKLSHSNELMTLTERIRLINIFSSLGVNKIRFTGGEPTLSKQLKPLLQHTRFGLGSKSMRSAGITTNGLLLKGRVEEYVSAGLTNVNISIDSLEESKYAAITRKTGRNLTRVLSAVYEAVAKGLQVKLNCVVIRGENENELGDFVRMTKDVPIDVRFIELMPFDGNSWNKAKFVGYQEMIDMLQTQSGVKLVRLSKSVDPHWVQDPHDTTKWFKCTDSTLSGYAGRVGFITSMSSHFCGGCNRLRVTADGKLKVCLFGEDSLDICSAMRDGQSDDTIVSKISEAIKLKKPVLGGLNSMENLAFSSSSNRPMILIGG